MISYLLHSVEPEIGNSVLYRRNASDIWKELEERFGQTNAPRLYQVQNDLAYASQGASSVASYFTHLKTLWDEYMSMLEVPNCTCGKGSEFTKILKNSKLCNFSCD